MKKLLLCLLLASCSKPSISNMVNSVVFVDGSSGVVVYSEPPLALILTAYHVVSDDVEEKESISIRPAFYAFTILPAQGYYSEKLDLALLPVDTKTSHLTNSKIATTDPELGDDIWLAANPNHIIRSLKKGIISSKHYTDHNISGWEVSGGVIFGSSGGGAFNMDGELFGVIRAVDTYDAGFCQAGEEEEECLRIALPEMGVIVPPEDVRSFVLSSSYSSYFDYLR
jgi:S1-C subfamily serine protease